MTSSFENTLWRQLVDEHGADEVEFTAPQTSRRITPAALTTGAVAGLAAAAAAVVLVLSGTTNTPPAYALTPHADGSYTLTLNSLTGDLSTLNAKLAQMGIDETVVPVTPQCTYLFPIYPVGGPSFTITLRPHHYDLAPGYQGVLAAEQLPDGKIALAQGALKPADIPSCFATVASFDKAQTPG